MLLATGLAPTNEGRVYAPSLDLGGLVTALTSRWDRRDTWDTQA